MTLFEPTIIVTRLVVERGSSVVYDEQLHNGVNIIRGENSSGKSTILNFIFYVLGGDLYEWSAVALLCSRVVAEVRLNGKFATLSRDISEAGRQPMEILGAPYAAATKAPRSEWVRYPYQRSAGKESFSQALFRLLGIPEAQNEASGNITMHQILRLLYADQLSPVDDIFRFERFDPPTLREAVGRLLCGAYDSRLYANELELRDVNKKFDEISGELRSLFAVLGRTDQGLTFDWIESQRAGLKAERDSIQTEIEAAEAALYAAGTADELTLAAQRSAYEDVQRLQSEVGNAQSERDALLLEIADSNAFIVALEDKLQALNDASTTASFVGEIRFHACPAC